MKTGIWREDTSLLQMGDWLAGLRDDGDAEVPAGPHVRAAGARGPQPEPGAATALGRAIAPVEAMAPAEVLPAAEALARAGALARARASARAEAMVRAEVLARAQAMTHAEARARARVSGRAVIGDELRIPVMWCELGACIAQHSDPAALGEADIRARAIAAGWRVDALGRLVCPRCQQTDGRFWAAHPVALHDRNKAPLQRCLPRDLSSAGGGQRCQVRRHFPRPSSPRSA